MQTPRKCGHLKPISVLSRSAVSPTAGVNDKAWCKTAGTTSVTGACYETLEETVNQFLS